MNNILNKIKQKKTFFMSYKHYFKQQQQNLINYLL